jgi:hypothetical protein
MSNPEAQRARVRVRGYQVPIRNKNKPKAKSQKPKAQNTQNRLLHFFFFVARCALHWHWLATGCWLHCLPVLPSCKPVPVLCAAAAGLLLPSCCTTSCLKTAFTHDDTFTHTRCCTVAVVLLHYPISRPRLLFMNAHSRTCCPYLLLPDFSARLEFLG